MAFININKVTLDKNCDAIEAMATALLVFASLTYDEIEKKDYGNALQQVILLQGATNQLGQFLLNEITKEEDSSGKDTNTI